MALGVPVGKVRTDPTFKIARSAGQETQSTLEVSAPTD